MNYTFTFDSKEASEDFMQLININCFNAELNRREPEYDKMLNIWIVDVVLTCDRCVGGKCDV